MKQIDDLMIKISLSYFVRSHTTEENLPLTAPCVEKLTDLSPKVCASPPILRKGPRLRDGSEPRKSVRLSTKVVEIPRPTYTYSTESNDLGTDEVDGVGGGLEREESDIVKEPEQREDSSLKRGTSKISRALDTLRLFKDGKGRYKEKK